MPMALRHLSRRAASTTIIARKAHKSTLPGIWSPARISALRPAAFIPYPGCVGIRLYANGRPQQPGGNFRMNLGGEPEKPALELYGIDLTARAKEGKLDPVIGRDAEVDRMIQLLSRRTKNNPVLYGGERQIQSRHASQTGPDCVHQHLALERQPSLRV